MKRGFTGLTCTKPSVQVTMRRYLVIAVLTVALIEFPATAAPDCSAEEAALKAKQLALSVADDNMTEAAKREVKYKTEELANCRAGRVASLLDIERNAQTSKVKQLVLSARLCAFRYELQIATKYQAQLKRNGIGSNDDGTVNKYRKLIANTERYLRDAKMLPLSCNAQIKQLWHCLPSLEQNCNSVGSPYGGDWCHKSPFAESVEADKNLPIAPDQKGQEDPLLGL